jgi:hypothetical protein
VVAHSQPVVAPDDVGAARAATGGNAAAPFSRLLILAAFWCEPVEAGRGGGEGADGGAEEWLRQGKDCGWSAIVHLKDHAFCTSRSCRRDSQSTQLSRQRRTYPRGRHDCGWMAMGAVVMKLWSEVDIRVCQGARDNAL